MTAESASEGRFFNLPAMPCRILRGGMFFSPCSENIFYTRCAIPAGAELSRPFVALRLGLSPVVRRARARESACSAPVSASQSIKGVTGDGKQLRVSVVLCHAVSGENVYRLKRLRLLLATALAVATGAAAGLTLEQQLRGREN